MAPSSIYGSRSTASLASARSRATVTHSLPGSRKLKPKWWQRRPLISSAIFTDLQKGSYAAAIFTLVESFIQIILAAFDAYCLIEARPGSKHFRNVGFSFLFVYSGNELIRRSLIVSSVILILIATYLLVSSIILMAALRKEHEVKFLNWIRAMAGFIVIRTLSLLFHSVANDLFFTYHQMMLVFWLLMIICNVFAFLVVISNYQELSNLTRFDYLARLKLSTISSLNASRSLSHHSLDSYNKGNNIVNSHPSPNVSVHGTPATLRSASIENHYFPQPSPRIGNPPSASSIPLAAFGLNLNPNYSSTRSLGGGSTPSTAPI